MKKRRGRVINFITEISKDDKDFKESLKKERITHVQELLRILNFV